MRRPLPKGSMIGLLGSALAVYLSLSLFTIPAGTTVRPMGLALAAFFVALITAGLGIPASRADRGRGLGWKIAAVALSLFPLGYVWVGWHLIALLRGFRFAD